MHDHPSVYETEIVRVFPDYAWSVIWFSGPFSYPETGLSGALVGRLEEWEARYYASLTDDVEWRSREALHAFDAAGLELAREVSAEIGPHFAVEYRSFENAGAVATLRTEHPATNAAAEAAFTARADRARAGWAAVRARRAAAPDSGGGWFARSSSGAIFIPEPPPPPIGSEHGQ
jgi:hypothetical protein